MDNGGWFISKNNYKTAKKYGETITKQQYIQTVSEFLEPSKITPESKFYLKKTKQYFSHTESSQR